MNRIDKMTDKMPIRAGAKSLMMQSKSDGRERSRKPLPGGPRQRIALGCH